MDSFIHVLVPVLAIVLLIVLNGIFVAAEFAIIGTPKTVLKTAVDRGDKRSKQILGIRKSLRLQDRYIAAAQLGVTISSLGLGMYGEHILAGWIYSWFSQFNLDSWWAVHSVASVLAIGFLTVMHVVIGEMVPKTVALNRPHETARMVFPIVMFMQWFLLPLIYVFNRLGNSLLKALGVRRQIRSSDQIRTPEELSLIVEQSQVGGKLKEASAEVVQELLEFGDLTAVEAMVSRTAVIGIPQDADDEHFQRILRDRPHTRYPVYLDTLDQIVGMVHVKDLLACLPNCTARLSSIMRPVPFVPHSADLEQVLRVMTRCHSQMAVVMDEQGGTDGIITIEDLFEEIVGDIRENVSEKPEIVEIDDGLLHVAGTVRIEDLGYELDLPLEHEDVDTVGGLVLWLLGRPAVVGDIVEYRGIQLQVLSVRGRGVRECQVRRKSSMD